MGKDLKGKELGIGLCQRASGEYQGRFTDKYGRRKTFYDKKLAVVKRKLNNAIYEDEHGLTGTGDAVRVEDWSRSWFGTYKANIREITKKSYKSNLNLINNQIGSMYLTKVKPMHIMKMVNQLHADGYAVSTIKGAKTVAYNMFQKAMENGLTTSNPVKGIQVSFEIEEDKVKALTVEQQRAFLKSIQGSHYCEMFSFMLLTGLRISETLAVRWSDIDWDSQMLEVQRNFVTVKIDGKYQYMVNPTKTKSSRRSVPLCKEAVEILEKQKAKGLNSRKKGRNNLFQDLVFLSRSGQTCSYSNIASILRSKAKVLRSQGYDIERLTTHMLRHTFCTRAHEGGMNMKTLSRIVGHSRLETTANIYTHVLPENALEEINKLTIIGLDVVRDEDV